MRGGARGGRKEDEGERQRRLDAEMDGYWKKGGITNTITQKTLDQQLDDYKEAEDKVVANAEEKA